MMNKIFLLVAGLHIVITLVYGQADKYTNENRPYNFGFTIPGEQHRQESKDENGIIMGEFGYLTADGIYHETIFATDKDGNYRILSQKNRRVGPSPWGKKTQETPTTTTTTTTTTTPPPPPDDFILRGKPGCSGCLIPTPPPPGAPPARPLVVPNIARFPSSGRPGSQPAGSPGPQGGRPGGAGASPGSPGTPPGGRPGSSGSLPGGRPGSSGAGPGSTGSQPGSPGSLGGRPISSGNIPPVPSGEKPFPPRGQFDEKPDPAFGTGKPNPLNPNTFPNSREPATGLPGGLTNDDIMGLLYKFNYTVGFHGHQETGYRNGDKEGEFFVHNRDGTARRVTYVANEKGFQPKVMVVKIDNVEDIPRAETEKEYGLKGYEFKWFNRR